MSFFDLFIDYFGMPLPGYHVIECIAYIFSCALGFFVVCLIISLIILPVYSMFLRR